MDGPVEEAVGSPRPWLVLAGAGAVLLTVLTAVVAAADGPLGADRSTLRWVVDHRRGPLDAAAWVLTQLGGSAVVLPVALVLGLVAWRRLRTARPLLYLLTTSLAAEVAFRVLKVLVGRARPPATDALARFAGHAYPSGHATLSTATWGAAALVVALLLGGSRAWPLVAAALVAVLVGLTRIELGAHWLTDVLGGWALGLVMLGLVTASLPPVARQGGARERPSRGAGPG